jgi:opacity protein-like surface antigen
MRKLDLRIQSGAGAKFTLLRDSTTEASLSVAGLYDREKLEDQSRTFLARWSWRAKGEKTLGGRVKVQHTTLFQPGWRALQDYLLTAQTGLSTKLNEHIALTVAYSYERDSTPAADAGPDDQTLNVGLRFEF